jgi:hypothetical protein
MAVCQRAQQLSSGVTSDNLWKGTTLGDKEQA